MAVPMSPSAEFVCGKKSKKSAETTKRRTFTLLAILPPPPCLSSFFCASAWPPPAAPSFPEASSVGVNPPRTGMSALHRNWEAGQTFVSGGDRQECLSPCLRISSTGVEAGPGRFVGWPSPASRRVLRRRTHAGSRGDPGLLQKAGPSGQGNQALGMTPRATRPLFVIPNPCLPWRCLP